MHLAVDTGSGPPVVLLHGQPGTHTSWLPALPALVTTPARLLVVDRPGYHGEPERARGFTGNAVRLLALLDELGLDRALLVGHSWGGGVALRTAALAPQRCSGLVLLASVGTRAALAPADRVLAAGPVRRLVAAGLSALPAALAGFTLAGSGSRLTSEDRAWLAAGLAEWRRVGAWRAFAVEQRALVEQTGELQDCLGSLAALPVSVVHGRRDRYVPVAAGRELARRIPGAVYTELDAGHLLPLETPEVLAAVVRETLARAARRGA